MPSNGTYYCATCDVASKGPSGGHPCNEPMQYMGKSWKPGRKGSRTRVFDKRKAPVLPWGYRQLPFEPPRRVGRKRARAMKQELPLIRKRGQLLPWWYIEKHRMDEVPPDPFSRGQ